MMRSVIFAPTQDLGYRLRATLETVARPVAASFLVLDSVCMDAERENQGQGLVDHARAHWAGPDTGDGYSDSRTLAVWAIELPGLEDEVVEAVSEVGRWAWSSLQLISQPYLIRILDGTATVTATPEGMTVIDIDHCSTSGEFATEEERLQLAAIIIAGCSTESSSANQMLRALEAQSTGVAASAHGCAWTLDRAALAGAMKEHQAGVALGLLATHQPSGTASVFPTSITGDQIVEMLAQDADREAWTADLSTRRLAQRQRPSLHGLASYLEKEASDLSTGWASHWLETMARAVIDARSSVYNQAKFPLESIPPCKGWLTQAAARLGDLASSIEDEAVSQEQRAASEQDRVGQAALHLNGLVSDLTRLEKCVPPLRVIFLGAATLISLTLLMMATVAVWATGSWLAWLSVAVLPAIAVGGTGWHFVRLLRDIDETYVMGRNLLFDVIAPANLEAALHHQAARIAGEVAQTLRAKATEANRLAESLSNAASNLLEEAENAIDLMTANDSRFVKSAFRAEHIGSLDPSQEDAESLLLRAVDYLSHLGLDERWDAPGLVEALLAAAAENAGAVEGWSSWDFVALAEVDYESAPRRWVHQKRVPAGHVPFHRPVAIFAPKAPGPDCTFPATVELLEDWSALVALQIWPDAVPHPVIKVKGEGL